MLTSLAIMLLCGLFLGAVFEKMRLPRLIGMLIVGIILGPYGFNVLSEIILNISADLRQLALIIILTRAGLSLDLDDLKQIGRPAIMMSFIPACFEMAATIVLSQWLFNLPLLDAGILAAIVASASPAVIVPRMLKLMETKYGTDKNIPQLILAGDSVDDIFNIVVFTSLLGLVGGEEISFIKFGVIPITIILGIFIGVGCGYLLTEFFQKVHLRDSAKVVIILSIAFLLVAFEAAAEHIVPISGLIAVMAAGVIILQRAPAVAERISNKFSKLWVAAEIMLFVLVGASVNINYVSLAGVKTVLMLVIVLIVRGVGILLCLVKTNLNRKERLFCALTGIPKATVQAAIGVIPLAIGMTNGDIILAVAVLSILFTAPLGAIVIDSTYKRLLTKEEG